MRDRSNCDLESVGGTDIGHPRLYCNLDISSKGGSKKGPKVKLSGGGERNNSSSRVARRAAESPFLNHYEQQKRTELGTAIGRTWSRPHYRRSVNQKKNKKKKKKKKKREKKTKNEKKKKKKKKKHHDILGASTFDGLNCWANTPVSSL